MKPFFEELGSIILGLFVVLAIFSIFWVIFGTGFADIFKNFIGGLYG